MKTFTVYEPTGNGRDAMARAESFVLVSEGFSWFAFLLAPVWAIANRAWLVLVGVIAAAIGIELLLQAIGVAEWARGFAGLLVSLLIGLEAPNLLRWTLERKGYREAGMVSGADRALCELQFLEAWAAGLERGGAGREDGPQVFRGGHASVTIQGSGVAG
ncbi:MAG: DUF2628 domain-containing protein [Rhizobiales bacterium]|nr:DUF2628 domain-containing protein [Hyphomicrobiales bacterium]